MSEKAEKNRRQDDFTNLQEEYDKLSRRYEEQYRALQDDIQTRETVIATQKLRIAELEAVCNSYEAQVQPQLNPALPSFDDNYDVFINFGCSLGCAISSCDRDPDKMTLESEHQVPAAPYNLSIDSILEHSNLADETDPMPAHTQTNTRATKRGADDQGGEVKRGKKQRCLMTGCEI
jgi:hypothetical protein